MYEERLTSQQRAVRVIELLRKRPHTSAELAAQIGMHPKSIYKLMDTLSSGDGAALTQIGRHWHLITLSEINELRALLDRLADGLRDTPEGALILSGGALRRHEGALLVRVLRRIIAPPNPE